MIKRYKTQLKDFDYPYFVSAFASKYGFERLKISKKSGILSEDFRNECIDRFSTFCQTHKYTIESVEKFFDVKFCHLRIESEKIHCFTGTPTYGEKIIYVSLK